MLLANVFTDLGDWLSGIQSRLSDITATEWFLLAAALAAVLWVRASIKAATTLGPIEVVPIEQDGSPDNPQRQLTARLRERIMKVGLRPPPGVPGGAPYANLLSAIEASPIPQANWIATLMKAIPWPKAATYKLTTTIGGNGNGVSYWLQPNEGTDDLMETLATATDDALDGIPEKVLLHVCKGSPSIFPPWSCWKRMDALEKYLEGLAAPLDQPALAAAAFEAAAALEPDNTIVQLRLLNVREILAVGNPLLQATVLRAYLDLVTERPELVQARYRASTLAGVVADAHMNATPEVKALIEAALGW
jgi:hypothetical protein